MNAYTDQQYLNGIKKGESGVLKSFYKDFFPTIKSLVLNNNGNEEDAKDIFQECTIVLFRKVQSGNFNLTAKLSTYIYSICQRLWWNRSKKNNRENSEIPEDNLLTMEDTGFIEKTEQYKLFREKFKEMGEKCQQILNLYFDKIKGKDIADKMKMSLPYTKKKLHTCKKKLIDLIKKDASYSELTN